MSATSAIAKAIAIPVCRPVVVVIACATMNHTGWVVVSMYASGTLIVPSCSAVLMVGTARHVMVAFHVCVCARVWMGIADMMLYVSVVKGPGSPVIHPTYVLTRPVLLLSVPRARLESYLSFLPGGWFCACVCHVML